VQLIELLRQAHLGDDDEATIYVARPWSPEAEAIVVSPAPDATNPIEQDGQTFDYFLEAFIAQEFLEDLAASNDAEAASDKQRCERLILYAEADA
jgi:hypothetical protein